MTDEVQTTDGKKRSLGDILKQVARTQRDQGRKLDATSNDVDALRDEINALRRHNAALAAAAFMLIAWKNDEIAMSLQNTDNDEARDVARGWIEQFSQLQGIVAPATFRAFYGLDPNTGDEVGPGAMTSGEVSANVFDVRLEDVPAATSTATATDAAREYLDGGALDNN